MLPIDKTWTLFLDRDGVLNAEKHMDYILNRDELRLYPETLTAMPVFTRLFGRIIVATNQKGIGKGLMTTEDLQGIHDHLLDQVMEAGGYIDAFYHAPDLEQEALMRKPQTGMANAAKEAFPEIEFAKSIMVGNNVSDMQFGRNAGMYTVFVCTTSAYPAENAALIDFQFPDIGAFADFLEPLIPLAY